MDLPPITTVFFDWDQTLAYTKTPDNGLIERLTLMFQMAGLTYTQEQMKNAVEAYIAGAGEEKLKAFREAQTRREIGNFYAHLLKQLGYDDVDWELLVRIYNSYAQLPWYLYDDSREVIEAVQQQGYDVSILSNTSRSARPNITRLVGDLVPSRRITISEEVGVHKPAKTIFHRAAARAHTPPENCLMVGDNLAIDAIASVENGGFAYGIWLDRKEQSNGIPLPPFVSKITTLAQLPALLNNHY
jgi:HAD superfamily hydrolase (TIGR01549 family)